VDVLPDPVEINRSVDAIVLQQRNGHAGNRRRFHVGKRAFQNTQTTHADNGFNLAGLNQRHDNGRTFRDQHRVAEFLGFALQILNRAQAALLAQQTEFVERRGAFALDPQAFGQQQQSTLVRHAGQRLAPHFVVDQHTDVIAINGVALQGFDDTFRVDFEFFDRQRRNRIILGNVVSHHVQDMMPLNRRLRNVLLRRANALLDDVPRNDERSGLHNQFVRRSIRLFI